MGVILFFLGICTFVPVGQIPLLRNLAYAMGYTPDELSHLSFFKALFSWSDHNEARYGDAADPNAIFVFGESGGFFNSKSEKATNKLFSIRSVNAYRRKQGQGQENVSGAYTTPNSEDKRNDVVRVRDPKAAATEANQESTGDVYFGTDANALQREKNDGYQSVNALKKISNPNVAGGTTPEDWFSRAVDRAVESDADLQGLEKNLNRTGNSLANLDRVGKIGNSRAKRDMYYAWMTGRAARRTPQVVLKKTLAAAGFNGAELPRTVFTASGPSGVGINPDEIVADLDTVQQYLKLDKKCQDALKGTSSGNMPTLDEIRGLVGGLTFPGKCSETDGSFLTGLGRISNRCNSMRGFYQTAQNNCSTLDIVVNERSCTNEKLPAMYATFATYCTWKLNQCNNVPEDQQAQCREDAENYSSENQFCDPPDGTICYNRDMVEEEIPETFYMGPNHNRLNTDYFPGIDWEHSLWLDEDSGD